MQRKNLKKGTFFSTLVLMFVLFGCASNSKAETSSDMNRLIQREKKALEKIEAEIRIKEKKDGLSKKKEQSLLSGLEVIDRRFSLLRKEAALLESEVKKKEREAKNLSIRISEVILEIEKARKFIIERVRSIYKEKQGASFNILFASQDYPELLRKLQYMKTVAQKEDEVLVLFEEKHNDLREKRTRLNLIMDQMMEDRETLARKLVESRKERKKKNRLLARIRRDRKLFKKAISEMTLSSQKVRHLISGFENREKQLGGALPGKFSAKKGRMRWPIDGKVATLFGRQKHHRFDEIIYRKGIEILPVRGGEVRSVFDGIVIYADWFRGYGMMVMIDHGENYYSLYAHLAKLWVGIGDRVKKDRPIGQVGGTGLSHGRKLYFEIRHHGEPINPLTWLQKRG